MSELVALGESACGVAAAALLAATKTISTTSGGMSSGRGGAHSKSSTRFGGTAGASSSAATETSGDEVGWAMPPPSYLPWSLFLPPLPCPPHRLWHRHVAGWLGDATWRDAFLLECSYTSCGEGVLAAPHLTFHLTFHLAFPSPCLALPYLTRLDPPTSPPQPVSQSSDPILVPPMPPSVRAHPKVSADRPPPPLCEGLPARTCACARAPRRRRARS